MLLGIRKLFWGCLDYDDSALVNGLILIEGLGMVHSLSPVFLPGEDTACPFLVLYLLLRRDASRQLAH